VPQCNGSVSTSTQRSSHRESGSAQPGPPEEPACPPVPPAVSEPLPPSVGAAPALPPLPPPPPLPPRPPASGFSWNSPVGSSDPQPAATTDSPANRSASGWGRWEREVMNDSVELQRTTNGYPATPVGGDPPCCRFRAMRSPRLGGRLFGPLKTKGGSDLSRAGPGPGPYCVAEDTTVPAKGTLGRQSQFPGAISARPTSKIGNSPPMRHCAWGSQTTMRGCPHKRTRSPCTSVPAKAQARSRLLTRYWPTE